MEMLCLLLIAASVLSESTFAAPVVDSPGIQSKHPGEWAEFTCSVSCSHSIDWYVEGYSGDITNTCSTELDGITVCKEVTQSCSSNSATSGYKETLRVLATPKMASSSVAVQCAAISKDLSVLLGPKCNPFLSYSRYALLTVRSLPTPPPTDPPSPTPVVCPTSVQQDVTVTSTVTDVLTSTQVHTVTHTLTHTVMVQATPKPEPVIGVFPKQTME